MSLRNRRGEGSSQLTGGSPSRASVMPAYASTRLPKPTTSIYSTSAHSHAECPIQPDHLAIEHHILNNVFCQRGILHWTSQSWWKGHLLAQRDTRGFW